MADKKRMVATIESIEERLPDNDRGWGKYKVKLEGHKGIYKVDVPADINAEYDLDEGFSVLIQEGPYRGWIVQSKSEFLTGEPVELESEAPAAKKAAPKRAAKKTPDAPKTAAPKSGNTHTAWNQYQIDVRDTQMRMQSITGIVKDIHLTCIKEGCDPSEVLDQVITDAQKLDEAITKYLGL